MLSPDKHLSSTHHFTAQSPTSLSTTVSSVQYSSSGPTLEHSMKEPEIDKAAVVITSESGPSSSVSASVSSHQEDLEHAQRLGSEDQDMQQTSSHSSISSSPRHSPLGNPAESLHPGPPPSSAHPTPPSATSSSPSSSTTADSRSRDQSHSLTDVSTCSSHDDNLPLSSPVLPHSVVESSNAAGGGNETLSAKSGHTSTAMREPHSLSEGSMAESLEQDRRQGSREQAEAGPPLVPTNRLNEDGRGEEVQAIQGHQGEASEDSPLPPVRSQQTDLQGTTATQEAGFQHLARSDTPPSDLPSLEPVGQSVSTHSIPVPIAAPFVSQAITTCAESPKQLSRSERSSIISRGVWAVGTSCMPYPSPDCYHTAAC